MTAKPILYVKAGCPWCAQALDFFKKHHVAPDVRDVLRDAEAMKRMTKISGQSKTPTLEYGDFLVADFSVDEFLAAVNAKPEIKAKLGL